MTHSIRDASAHRCTDAQIAEAGIVIRSACAGGRGRWQAQKFIAWQARAWPVTDVIAESLSGMELPASNRDMTRRGVHESACMTQQDVGRRQASDRPGCRRTWETA